MHVLDNEKNAVLNKKQRSIRVDMYIVTILTYMFSY